MFFSPLNKEISNVVVFRRRENGWERGEGIGRGFLKYTMGQK